MKKKLGKMAGNLKIIKKIQNLAKNSEPTKNYSYQAKKK